MSEANFCKFNQVYTNETQEKINQDFKRLNDTVYLDHAGTTLYSEKQMENIFKELSTTVFGNPHTHNNISKSTDDAIDVVRYRILKHFNTNEAEYSVIFTASATAALKAIGECFIYGVEGEKKGSLCYLVDNHTSVLGMRAFSENIHPLSLQKAQELAAVNEKRKSKIFQEDNVNSLFVYPAQSNFSGTKYPLEWVDKAQNGALEPLLNTHRSNWFVLLDAATYAATNVLDLTKFKADFIPLSFYKLFGYPTGLGALLVRKSSAHVLSKKYYGGGTVLMAMAQKNVFVPKNMTSHWFEEGSLPFLSIISLKHGFETVESFNLNWELISKHTFSLAQYVFKNLITLHHSNGQPVAVLYHDTQFESNLEQGGIVNFNLLRNTGGYVGYAEVMHMASLNKIQLRTGCSCNPGACQSHLKLSSEDVQRHFDAGHVCGDQHDLVDGYPTGSVRISFGYMSTKNDADKFLTMIEECFITKPIVRKNPAGYTLNYFNNNDGEINGTNDNNKNTSASLNNNGNKDITRTIPKKVSSLDEYNVLSTGKLESILLYPIKSCAAFWATQNWELTSQGPKYDRQWMILNKSGICVSQKHIVELCLLQPIIDLENEDLELRFPDQPPIKIPLDITKTKEVLSLLESKVCTDRVNLFDCGKEVAKWLNKCFNTSDLRLVQQITDSGRTSCRTSKDGKSVNLSLTNKAQYLLLNTSSVQWLRNKIEDDLYNEDLNSIILRFRPNFVISFSEPFVENEVDFFCLDDVTFKSDGPCTRCQMICINQCTGEKTSEPLLTLSKALSGKIAFGTYLSSAINKNIILNIGCNVLGLKNKK